MTATDRLADVRPRLARAWAPLVAGAAGAALLIYLAFQHGGYFAPSQLRAGALGFVVLAILLAIKPPAFTLSTETLLAVGAIAGLAVWTALSTSWSNAPDTGLEDFQRDLVYVALFGLGLLAAGSSRYAPQLVWGALTVILVIVGAGLLSRLQPDVVTPEPLTNLSGYRLGYPFGYWNAYGMLAAVGGVLALGLSADPRSARPLRALAAGAAVLFTVGMYLSLSRGAWLAMIAGLIALVVLGAHRISLAFSFAIVGWTCVTAIAKLREYPALVDDPHRGGGQLAAGHAYTGKLLLLVAIAIAGQAFVGYARPSPELKVAMRRVLRPVAIGLAGLALVVLAGFYLAEADRVDRFAASKVDAATSYVDRQWRDFLKPTTFSQGGTGRLGSAKGTRSDLYRVAWDGFEAHPLWGDGAGGFQARWVRTRKVDEYVRNAHSLYLETAGELGLPGLLLLLGFVGAILFAAARSRLRPGGLARAQSAAVGAACTVWIVHSAVDWDWQIPAASGVVFLLAATLFPTGRRPRRRSTAVEHAGYAP